MKRSELIKYENQSVILKYNNAVGLQDRTGYIKSITMEVVVFWPMMDEKEIELQILFKDIEDVKLI